jgi:hypothetical protein
MKWKPLRPGQAPAEGDGHYMTTYLVPTGVDNAAPGRHVGELFWHTDSWFAGGEPFTFLVLAYSELPEPFNG